MFFVLVLSLFFSFFLFSCCLSVVDRSTAASCRSMKKDCPDMDPMFVVRCWNRVRGHILREALSEDSGGGGGEHTVLRRGNEADACRSLSWYAVFIPCRSASQPQEDKTRVYHPATCRGRDICCNAHDWGIRRMEKLLLSGSAFFFAQVEQAVTTNYGGVL